MIADGPDFTHIHQSVFAAGRTEQIGDAVGGVALRNAIERHSGARFCQADHCRIDLHGFIPHERACSCNCLIARPYRVGARSREMPGVQIPQRLHSGIESACRETGKAAGDRQELDQFRCRRVKATVSVEPHDFRIITVKTENALQPPHFVQRSGNETVGRCSIGVKDLQRRIGSQCYAAPMPQPA